MKADRVFVYGAGRVGRSLGRAIESAGKAHGLALCGAWNRTFPRALATSRLLGVEVSAGDALPEALPRARIVIMSVPDDAIGATAAALARHLDPRQILLHTSGSLPASAMGGGGMRAGLGCVHPLQALADPEGDPRILEGSTFAIEGTDEVLDAARRVALAAKGEPVVIPSRAKVYYHAAAVMSANYLTVLVDAARELLVEANVDAATGIRMLMPLLEGTLSNIARLNSELSEAEAPDAGLQALSQGLTGPVRRGDVGTVKKHLKALDKLSDARSDAADLPDLYRLLAARASEIARRGDLDDARADALLKALRRKR